MHRVRKLIERDKWRLNALQCVQLLDLPECYLAAGFVRNMVWDHLHLTATALNDVDVIYFDRNESDPNKCKQYELTLKNDMPDINWQVRNQALMHTRNGDEPYSSTLDAMSYWPEKETAVAVRLVGTGDIECISAFALDSLFNLQITHNPQRLKSIFEDRVKSKKWLIQWGDLTIAPYL